MSRSGYYAWRGRKESARSRADARLKERIRAIRQTSRGTSGSPRIRIELRAVGDRCGRRHVARLMRQAGRRGCHGQHRQIRTMTPDRPAVLASDRANRAFSPSIIGAADRRWVADLSYIATHEDWLYLAVILDAFRRWGVG